MFDGAGIEAAAEIVRVDRRSVELRVIDRHEAPVPAVPPLSIAVAPPKGDRLRFLVEKLTELGVARLILLETERAIVEPRDRKLGKLGQTVIAACKQCGRSRLMEIAPPMSFDQLIACGFANAVAVIAHPTGEPLGEALSLEPADRPLLALVGPEGGFTDSEVAAAIAAGARPVSLGETILRIETAALALAACALLRRGFAS